MKTFSKYMIGAALAVLLSATAPCSADMNNPKVAIVNFKTIVENSKLGKEEQANFEKMKKQMEDVLAEKEKALKEISAKFNDEDYLDGLSDEAEAELKHKARNLSQELAQHQQQFFQVLQQANYKIIQKINEEIEEVAQEVAKSKNIDLIINEEGTFYFSPALNISDDVVKAMDKKQ